MSVAIIWCLVYSVSFVIATYRMFRWSKQYPHFGYVNPPEMYGVFALFLISAMGLLVSFTLIFTT